MAVEMYFAWGQSSASVAAGETVSVPVTADIEPSVDKLSALFSPYAVVDSATTSAVVIRGVSAGSITVHTGRDIAPQGSMDMTTYPDFTLTVTAPVDDQNFLNERGLTHFWNNIDTLKQDKLTAGTNITISANNTISASQPTVGNATLTIQKNGTNVQTFTANATSNKTANITVPTKTSDLTNDSNFVADANYVHTDNNYTTTEKNKLAGIAAGAEVNVQANWAQTTTTADDYIKNKPTIPTVNNGQLTIQKNGTNVATFTANAASNVTANISVPTATSDLTNDSGFIASITKITNAEIDAIMGVS